MQDISLHILDIVENSLKANAKNIQIRLLEDKEKDLLILEIKDDGEGMSERTKQEASKPFFTTKEGKKVGLGLALLAQSVEEAGGSLEIESAADKGTKIIATFGLSHIDRKPLGNIDETMKCLKGTHPEVNFSFEYTKTNSEGGRLDSRTL